MEDERTNETTPIEPEEKEAPVSEGEKLFTQAEVNKIIKERLDRLKKKDASETEEAKKADAEKTAAKEKELLAREMRISCREYLIDRKYPTALIDAVKADTFEEFKKNADAIALLIGKKTAPMASNEGSSGDIDRFSEATRKHTPKKYY